MTTMYDLYDVYDKLVNIWRKRYGKGDKEFPTEQEMGALISELELQRPENPKIGKPYGSARFWD